MPNTNRQQAVQAEFKGLDDWVEIFRAGEQTDSAGRSRVWTTGELDEMVGNHSAETAAPIVVGHPETSDPAYGWIDAMRRDGDSLQAKFKDISPEFEQSVNAGHYRTRSVRIYKTPENTLAIEHVGWLGGQRPAIPLDAMNYEARADGDVFDFESDFKADTYTPNVLARFMRRMREWFIAEHGQETADQIVPDYEVDSITEHVGSLRNANSEASPVFSAPAGGSPPVSPPSGDSTMPDSVFTQADIDAAVKRGQSEKQAEFSAQERTLQAQLDDERRQRREVEFSAEVSTLVDQGKLLPAQAIGLPEFMASLGDGDCVVEFSSGEGSAKTTVSKSPLEIFRDFMASLPKQIEVGDQHHDDAMLDADDIDTVARAAQDFVARELAAGRVVSYTHAVNHVKEGAK